MDSSLLSINDKYSQLNLESNLCFPKDIFYAATFDVDAFLSHYKREYTLERLRDDLSVFLKVLEMSMCELINKDYPDFVNLSTNLVDLEKGIDDLKLPLDAIKNEVDNVNGSIDKEIENVMNKLNEKLIIEKRRIVLKLLMNWQRSFKVTNEMIGNDSKKITGDHLERLAFEFCQLKTSLSICSGENKDVLAQNNDISKLSQMLEKIMQELFLSCFILKDDSSVSTNLDKEENRKQMRHVLKSYSLLSKQRLVEQLYTDFVVKPFMNQHITEYNFDSNFNGLKGVLEKVLDFIDNNHDFLLLAYEIKSSTTSSSGGSEPSEKNEFEFVLNSIFSQLVTTLDLNLHSIFSPADPDLFHAQFTAAFDFINRFESKCSVYDCHIKRKLLHSPTYKMFVKKWPVQVYYQIRFQEIVSRFEDDLIGYDRLIETNDDEERFSLAISESLLKQMEYCWQENRCFLKCLVAQFWKLNLQLISRYCLFFIRMFQDKAKEETNSEININPDDTMIHSTLSKESQDLNLCILLINDVDKLLYQKLPNFFDGVIAPTMRLSNAIKDIPLLKEAFNGSLTSMTQLQSFLNDFIVQVLTKKCMNHLKNANDIPRLYRRTGREVPKLASTYITATVEAIEEFREAYSKKSGERQQELISKCVQFTIDSICLKYQSIVSDLLESVRKMEDSMRKLQRVRKNANNPNTSTPTISDDDKIRIQLYIDVVELGRLFSEKFNGYQGESNYEALFKLVESIQANITAANSTLDSN